jgi:hypothetical protein
LGEAGKAARRSEVLRIRGQGGCVHLQGGLIPGGFQSLGQASLMRGQHFRQSRHGREIGINVRQQFSVLLHERDALQLGERPSVLWIKLQNAVQRLPHLFRLHQVFDLLKMGKFS